MSDCDKLFMTVKFEDFYKDPTFLEQYSYYYEVYDLYSGKEITLEDLFINPDSVLKKVIIPELVKSFKNDYGEELTNDIALDNIDLPDCFAIGADGICFVYNPESLQATKVPYEFTVSYAKLLPYFKASFRKRFVQ